MNLNPKRSDVVFHKGPYLLLHMYFDDLANESVLMLILFAGDTNLLWTGTDIEEMICEIKKWPRSISGQKRIDYIYIYIFKHWQN